MELQLPNHSQEPIYRQIADAIAKAVEAGQVVPGQKLPPHLDLAKTLRVNPLTVSRGYEFLESKGIIRQRRGTGTFVELDALQKVQRASKRHFENLTVVLGAPSLAQCRRETAFMITNVLDGLRDVINSQQTQWHFVESITRDSLKHVTSNDAIVFHAARDLDHKLLYELLLNGIPIISVLSLRTFTGVPSVEYDRIQSTTLAVEHLMKRGYKRIGYIGAKSTKSSTISPKYFAFNSVLHDAGYTVQGQHVRYANVDPGRAYAAARDILSAGDLPDAFFVDTDYKAMEVICALNDAGLRVPEDVGIVAYDNIPESAQFHPPLTTVSTPRFEMGRVVGQMLLDWSPDAPPSDVVLKSELIVRNSTAPFKKKPVLRGKNHRS